jgi:hypothetical protein
MLAASSKKGSNSSNSSGRSSSRFSTLGKPNLTKRSLTRFKPSSSFSFFSFNLSESTKEIIM